MGILIDTFVVRTITVPALAAMIGRANWWPAKTLAKAPTKTFAKTKQATGSPAAAQVRPVCTCMHVCDGPTLRAEPALAASSLRAGRR